MRTLDPASAAAKDSPHAAPAVILRIDFPEPAGTRHFADREITVPGLEAEPRLAGVGRIGLALGRMRPAFPECEVRLADPDGSLGSLLKTVELQGLPARLYAHFEGEGAGAMTPLAVGSADGPVAVSEADATVSFRLRGLARKWAVDFGRAASGEDFPDLGAEDRGRMLPVVYGRMRLAPALAARVGRRGRLLADCSRAAGSLIVSGFEDLPDGTPLSLEIGNERVTGTIAGRMFTATARGASVASGVTTHATGRRTAIRDAGLAGQDNEFAGRMLRLYVDGEARPGDAHYSHVYSHASRAFNPSPAGTEMRPIIRFVASSGTIEYFPPFSIERARSVGPGMVVTAAGSVREIPVGTAYEIVTLAEAHLAGEEVRQVVQGGEVYLLNDSPSTRVDAVYVWGRRELPPASLSRRPVLLGGGIVGILRANAPGVEARHEPEPSWVPVPPEHCRVNVEDWTTFPALGRAVTTVTFPRGIGAIPGVRLSSREVRADVTGPSDQGAVIENPAAVIRDICVRYGGLDPETEVDSASFDSAASAFVRRRFAFSAGRVRRLPVVAGELAFQAGAALLWRAGRLSMRALPAGAGQADHVINAPSRIEGSLIVSSDGSDELATAVVASFIEEGEERELTVTDEDAAAVWGVRARKARMWACGDAAQAEASARFWLVRWSSIRRRVRFATFLQSLAVEPGDLLRAEFAEVGPWPVTGEVERVVHVPGSAVDARMDRIEIELRLPVWAGCASGCELACEASCMSGCECSCETACQTACEVACESSCQGVCELDCASAAEAMCQDACMVGGCEVGCEAFVTSIDGWDCAACETSCQSACEPSQEV